MTAPASRPWSWYAGCAARLVLAAVFLAACLPKIAHPHAFAESIYRYQLLHAAAINAAAVFLPWLELTAALALLAVPRLQRGAVLLVAVLLVIFTGAIAINLHRGVDIACGCFSVSESRGHIGWWNLARNAALLALLPFAWPRPRSAEIEP